MLSINNHYLELKENYLFSEIGKRANSYISAHPDKKVIKLGIGDVTLPLCDSVIKELQSGVNDMSKAATFHGYGPEQGYGFLKDSIKNYYASYNVTLNQDEIFVSDGAKSDLGNILDIFDKNNIVLVPDPVYPVYVDTNIMDGRTINFLNANEENGFKPLPDKNTKGDIIYICSPNNPTGSVYTKDELKMWVNYALTNGSIILFDAAYEAFISDKNLPRSIYEIDGAKKCAIEFCSLSKTAGFTGTRCGYTIVPNDLIFNNIKLNKLWLRRQTTKFNGVSYIIQKGAAAVFTKEGFKQTRANIEYYRRNAHVITDTLDKCNIWYCGGKNSPYIWLKCPNNMDSWSFFDLLLTKANVVGTPGEGFGNNGKGFFRLTSFLNYENTVEAMKRFENIL